MSLRPRSIRSMTSARSRAVDTAFSYLDRPATPLHVGGLAIFEPDVASIDYEQLVQIIEERIALVPRYRQRLRAIPARLGPPVWVDDAAFDLTYHVRRSALPRPGSDAELLEFCGRIQSRRLDRSRPLWEMYLVEGLSGGRFAIATKTHPSLVDGMGALDMTEVLLDASLTPNPRPPALWMPHPEPGTVELVAGALGALARRPAQVTQTVAMGLADARSVTRRVSGLLSGTVRTAAAVVGGTPSSPLQVRVSEHRRLATACTELDDYRTLRAHTGASVHDAILATVAGALRGWLLYRNITVTGSTMLRALVPLSVRDDGAPRVVPVPIDLPVGEPDPALRLARIRYAMAAAVAARPVLGADALVTLSGFAPPSLLALAARTADGLAGRTYQLSVTNAPGPQRPRYLAGARMIEMFAFLPLHEGKAVSLGVTSYAGGVYYGCTGDRVAMPDLAVLAHLLEESVAELLDAVAPVVTTAGSP